MLTNAINVGASVLLVVSMVSQGGNGLDNTVQLSVADPEFINWICWGELVTVLLKLHDMFGVKTLMKAWLLIVIFTATCWLFTAVPGSVS